jgi:ABC-type multidrug transport system fused ATPase/permease subunit
MVYKLLRAPINLFHDLVPIGQLLNRLTKDIDLVQTIIVVVTAFLKTVICLLVSI